LNRTTRTPVTKSPIRLSASSGSAHIKMFWSQHSPVAPSAEAARNRRSVIVRDNNNIPLVTLRNR
jgi:hypothetical protein